MIQKMFNYFDIDNSLFGKLISFFILNLFYISPYLILTTIGVKPSYNLADFIFINNLLSNTILLLVLVFTIYIANRQVKPQNHAEWIRLKANNPITQKTFSLNNIISEIGEEVINRYSFFFSFTTFLVIFQFPETITIVLFIAISSHLFAKIHEKSSHRYFYYFYFVAGVILSLTFLLSGIVGSILIHIVFNNTKRMVVNYHLSHPI